ncbi:MAG TPA: Hsp20/alpha crystallin family protein [Terriglobia bacterium]|nr:Hsp20/alpha crystallin family protein [Terriglobia bacterium]
MDAHLSVRKSNSILSEIERMRDRVMQRAYDIFSRSGERPGREVGNWLEAESELVWNPAMELAEKDNGFRIEVAIAGVDPKDIVIEATPEDILIKADVHHEHTAKKGEVHVCEFAHGSLFRSIRLPRRIDVDKVKAEFRNGLLILEAPAAEAARKILVDAA